MHPDEDVVGCMRREIFEESGLECTAMQLRGTINWTGFGPDGENWLGFIFLITAFSSAAHAAGPQRRGRSLAWHPVAGLDRLPMSGRRPVLCRWCSTTIRGHFTASCLCKRPSGGLELQPRL